MTRSILYKYNVIMQSFSLNAVKLLIKMFRLQSIVMVLLVMVDFHHYCSTDTALETILDFLELHFTYCTISQLCSVSSSFENNKTFNEFYEEPCCQTCSCEKECENDDTCCPDFLLHKIIDNVTFSDVTSLRNQEQHINYTAVLGINNNVHQSKYNDMYDCVDIRLIYEDVNYDIPKIKKAYEMIMMCPNRYLANTSTKYLCEVSVHEYRKSMVDFDSSNLEELVSIFTPVTSLKTNITYRNVFCLACSGEIISDDAYISWTAFLICAYSTRFEDFPSITPYEVFYLFLTDLDNYYRCNIITKPPKVIEHLTPKICTPSDFKTCPFETDARLDLFCQSFNLPVKQLKQLNKFTMYKNIACFLCNQDKLFVETCTTNFVEFQNVFEIGLNLRTTTELLSAYVNTSNVGTIKNENSFENIDNNAANSSYRNGNSTTGQEKVTISKLEDMKKLSSSYCNNNTDSKTCGDIMCPLYFYENHGECIPTFTSFRGMYFSICLEIEPTQSQPLNIVLPVMNHSLDSVARSFFKNYSLEIWSSVEEEEPKIIVAIINIISPDPDFISTISRIDLFLQNMSDIRFQTEQGMVDIGFKFANEYDYYFVGVQYNLARKLEAYRRGTQLAMPLHKMQITRMMGCYRTEIIEKKVDAEHFRYLYTNHILFESDFNEGKWTFKLKYISCLADAIQTSFRITDAYMFKGFAGKSSSPIYNIQEKEAIFIENNESKDKSGTVSVFSFGVRDGNIYVAAVVTMAVILLTILMN